MDVGLSLWKWEEICSVVVEKGRLPTKTMKRVFAGALEASAGSVASVSVLAVAADGLLSTAFAFLRSDRGEARFAFFAADERDEAAVALGLTDSVKGTKSCPPAILSSRLPSACSRPGEVVDCGTGAGLVFGLSFESSLSFFFFSFPAPSVLEICAFLDFRSERF